MLAELAKLKPWPLMSLSKFWRRKQLMTPHAALAAQTVAVEVKRQTHGLSWEDTVCMLHERVQEERAQREAEQVRRHEIDLQNAQIAAAARNLHPSTPRK